MDFRNIYERVNREKPISQSEFIARCDEIIDEICSAFGEKNVFHNGSMGHLTDKLQTLPIRDEYAQAIVYGVLATQDANYYNKFVDASRSAWHSVFRKKAHGKRIRRSRYDV